MKYGEFLCFVDQNDLELITSIALILTQETREAQQMGIELSANVCDTEPTLGQQEPLTNILCQYTLPQSVVFIFETSIKYSCNRF